MKVRFEIVSADFPLDEDFIYAASIRPGKGALETEDGVPLVMGINTPTREQLAHAEAQAQSPCLKCSNNHRPWERCSRTEGERQMAKDKGKKKDKKKAKEEAAPPVDPMEAAGVLDTKGSDLDSIVTELSDLLGRLRNLNVAAGDTADSDSSDGDTADTPEPEKAKKKGKKDKGSKEEAVDTTVTYTQKQLDKIGEKGAEGRKELVGILTSLGVPEEEMKSKRYTTLISMVLTKQEELKSGDAGEFTAEGTEGGQGEGWDDDEDVPPADEKKDKKGKKKKKSKK